MNLSQAGVYDQLIAQYGENFTEEEAQYAVDNVEVDWKENALKKGKHIKKRWQCLQVQFMSN